MTIEKFAAAAGRSTSSKGLALDMSGTHAACFAHCQLDAHLTAEHARYDTILCTVPFASGQLRTLGRALKPNGLLYVAASFRDPERTITDAGLRVRDVVTDPGLRGKVAARFGRPVEVMLIAKKA